jgi:hypothetical protein
MTAEVFITAGVVVADKPALRTIVRAYVSRLGDGHVDTEIQRGRDGSYHVLSAHAQPTTAPDFDIDHELENHLNGKTSSPS